MKPIEFKEQNKVLGKPESMTDEECSSLPVFSNGAECISCWQFTEEEIQKLIETKRIWIGIVSGQTQPPIFLSVDTPFEERKNDGKWKIYIVEVDGEKFWIIAQSEESAVDCLLLEHDYETYDIDLIREATMEEIESTKIQCIDEMKMPTLMDYHLNYIGEDPQIICSTLYVEES